MANHHLPAPEVAPPAPRPGRLRTSAIAGVVSITVLAVGGFAARQAGVLAGPPGPGAGEMFATCTGGLVYAAGPGDVAAAGRTISLGTVLGAEHESATVPLPPSAGGIAGIEGNCSTTNSSGRPQTIETEVHAVQQRGRIGGGPMVQFDHELLPDETRVDFFRITSYNWCGDCSRSQPPPEKYEFEAVYLVVKAAPAR